MTRGDNMTKVKKRTRKRKTARVRRPEVVVSIPRNAKLIVKRKAHNPYIITVNEGADGRSSKKHTWYSDDYSPNVGGPAGGM